MIIKAISITGSGPGSGNRGVDEVHFIDGLSRITVSQGARAKTSGFDGAALHWAYGEHHAPVIDGDCVVDYPDDGVQRSTFHALAWSKEDEKFVSITVYSASNVWLENDRGETVDRLL